MNINSYLNSKGFGDFEGNTNDVVGQVEDLIGLSNSDNAINVMEIGFNAGHSAEVFLKNNRNLSLTSFDIGTHEYVTAAKEYIDRTYPNRHTLVIGNSTSSIPSFARSHATKFDVIFIDGGHDYETANADLSNCLHLAHKDTIVILDDTLFSGSLPPCTVGPTRTWTEHLQAKKINELERKDYGNGRGMVWGRYKMS